MLEQIQEIKDKIINLCSEQKEKKNSHDSKRSEENVEYALKWLSKKKFTTIDRDCSNKYSDSCIVLRNGQYKDEHQEYDHIVVSDRAVFLIETKNYRGNFSLNEDGEWFKIGADGEKHIFTSPLMQIQRHHNLMESILENYNLPIYDVVCLAHKDNYIDNKQYFRFPIVRVESLVTHIQDCYDRLSESTIDMNEIAKTINNFKINAIY